MGRRRLLHLLLSVLPLAAGCGRPGGGPAPASPFVRGGPDGSSRPLGRRRGLRARLSNM